MRCDGLVAATPAGSTGYNLANQGPILAWGVAGFVVSFIAPHTLTARALVVAPDDVLQVGNAAGREAVDVVLDGEYVGELGSGQEVEVGFRDDVGRLAQLPAPTSTAGSETSSGAWPTETGVSRRSRRRAPAGERGGR